MNFITKQNTSKKYFLQRQRSLEKKIQIFFNWEPMMKMFETLLERPKIFYAVKTDDYFLFVSGLQHDHNFKQVTYRYLFRKLKDYLKNDRRIR